MLAKAMIEKLNEQINLEFYSSSLYLQLSACCEGDIFRTTLEHEFHITKCINGLAHVAFTTQDYSTFNFLQWYVAEQHEEEKLFKSIVDRLSLVGEDGKGLYFIDKELAELAKGAPASIMDGNA